MSYKNDKFVNVRTGEIFFVSGDRSGYKVSYYAHGLSGSYSVLFFNLQEKSKLKKMLVKHQAIGPVK